jgi:hypothetical protein
LIFISYLRYVEPDPDDELLLELVLPVLLELVLPELLLLTLELPEELLFLS